MQRSIAVMVSSPNDSQSCSVLVSVVLVNDNPPVVDSNGPLQPSINHNVTLNYNFVSQASVWITSRDATVTDLDADGRVEMLQVELTPGFPGDGVFLSASVGCPIDSSSTCHLRRVTCLARVRLGLGFHLPTSRSIHRLNTMQPSIFSRACASHDLKFQLLISPACPNYRLLAQHITGSFTIWSNGALP